MNCRKAHKVFWVVLVISVYAPSQVLFASSLERYLNYDVNNSNPPLVIAENQDKQTFHYSGSNSDEDTCWMSMGKAHKYLGYGTLAFAAAAAVSGGNNGFHKGAGVGAAGMAVAACTTGFMEYSNYFDTRDGFSAHNVHIVLGTIATVGFVATAASAIASNNKGHAGLGMGSTVLLVVPIVVLKW